MDKIDIIKRLINNLDLAVDNGFSIVYSNQIRS